MASLPIENPVRFIFEYLSAHLFNPNQEESTFSWRVSPKPFQLSPNTFSYICTLGEDLFLFYQALNSLYHQSVHGHAPAFIMEYLDQGKPEHIIKLCRQNRFKQDIPRVIRPDLLLTETGLVACELDNVPGGMGFVGAMTEAYTKTGISVNNNTNSIASCFAKMLRSLTKTEIPTVVIIVSEEAADYRSELIWLAENLSKTQEICAYVRAPQDIIFREDAVFIRTEDHQEKKIDVLYRNFELFDLLNIPKQELMLYAARHHYITMTPPPKAYLEEKLSFALFHHPALITFWKKELGLDAYTRLENILPKTWVLDPTPLPPHAVIYNLEANGSPIQNWMQLSELSKRERNFVVKPSGFSELAWGAHGVKIANDLTQEEWHTVLVESLSQYQKNPRILQIFHKAKKVKQSYFNPEKDQIEEFEGRVRLCPYFFVVNHSVELGGILATIVPSDKKVIHGMKDAVMTICESSLDGY